MALVPVVTLIAWKREEVVFIELLNVYVISAIICIIFFIILAAGIETEE